MKKIILLLGMLIPFSVAAETIELPKPDVAGGMPLMEAVAKRKTMREFSAKQIDMEDLSNILFAAWGVSHDDKRTIPTARNRQDMSVYAFWKGKVWKYDGQKHLLEAVSDKSIADALTLQDFVKEAPLTLIFVGKPDDKGYWAMHAGSAYQNVGLYCASRGLNNVVRGMIDKKKIADVLGIEPEEVIITQTVGWPYM